jgi:hypothetical protein
MKRQRISPDRVSAILKNEWGQLLGNKVVVFTTLGPPLLLVAIALSALLMSSWIGGLDVTKLNLKSLSPDQQKAVVDSLKETLPGAATANIDTFYDHRFVDQLDRGR